MPKSDDLAQAPPSRSDKVAMITGSGRDRVGAAIARMLARHGYHIVLHFHQSAEQAEENAEQLRQQGTLVQLVQADVSEPDQVQQMFHQVQDRWGRLDVLVTTASIWSPRPFHQVTADDVLQNFRVNTLGTFLCGQMGGLQMAAQPEGGVIVTIGDWAIQRPYPNHAAYFVAKGAIPTLTRTLAVELAHRNPRVRVNCIHPGPVMFPESMSQEERQATLNATLLKTGDQPEAVAHAVLFFVHNPLTTGVCLPVDCGRSIYAPTDVTS